MELWKGSAVTGSHEKGSRLILSSTLPFMWFPVVAYWWYMIWCTCNFIDDVMFNT